MRIKTDATRNVGWKGYWLQGQRSITWPHMYGHKHNENRAYRLPPFAGERGVRLIYRTGEAAEPEHDFETRKGNLDWTSLDCGERGLLSCTKGGIGYWETCVYVSRWTGQVFCLIDGRESGTPARVLRDPHGWVCIRKYYYYYKGLQQEKREGAWRVCSTRRLLVLGRS